MPKYNDGEVLGVDNDGSVIQWDSEHKHTYNSGESLEDFGINNLNQKEKARLKRKGIL